MTKITLSSLNNSLYRNSLFLVLLLVVFQSCKGESEEADHEASSVISTTDPEENSIQSEISDESIPDNFSFSTVYTDNQGWGYQIFNNEKLYINQPHIPAVEGVSGFSSEDKASKTAQFAIYKIENEILTPR